jgi:hypothetical protein
MRTAMARRLSSIKSVTVFLARTGLGGQWLQRVASRSRRCQNSGLDLAAIAASPKENLAGTLAAFVTLACIPIAVRRLAR